MIKNLIKEDEVFAQSNASLTAVSPLDKILVIVYHLLPGLLVGFLLNNTVLFNYGTFITRLSSTNYQILILLLLTLGWHIFFPIYLLKTKYGYDTRRILQTLSLHHFSWKDFFIITPLFFIATKLFTIPYLAAYWLPIHEWLNTIELFKIPAYYIFDNYEEIYQLPAWLLGLLFIGNFVGEEIYFRGYLMKRASFLGGHTWWITSLLFVVYHFWQIPMTYPMMPTALFYGLFMIWRKNLYGLMFFHVLDNLSAGPIMTWLFG